MFRFVFFVEFLRKVFCLILSYYFPPSRFVGGQRTEYWANHLSEYGIYPIVLTRQWNEGQKDLLEKPNQKKLQITYNDNNEIHYLPIENSLKNKIAHLIASQQFLDQLQTKVYFFIYNMI